MSLLKDRSFLATAAAHFVVDMLNSQRALILAVFSVSLGLTNTLIGLVNTVYVFTASLSQPLFGLLADRIGARWVAAGGVLWMAGTFAVAVSFEGYWTLVILILAAIGSAAFHPAGTLEATARGRHYLSGRETTAASFFFLFGQSGLSLGPAIGGPIIDQFGLPGLVLLLLLVLPVGFNAAFQITPLDPREADVEENAGEIVRYGIWTIVPFVLFTGLRSWTQANMIAFLPKYYSDLGYRPTVYGVIAALFMGGSAIGGVIGGWLADRYNKRRIAMITLLGAVLPLFLFPFVGRTMWAYLIVPLAGVLTGASHSIIVILAQRMSPQRMGMASGIVLGLTFVSGAFGTFLSGFQADLMGLDAMFLTTAGIAFLASIFTIRLPES